MNFHPVENSIDSAKIVVPLLIDWYKPNTVIDLGCNIGAWLSEFQEHGIDILGIDGENMLGSLLIDAEDFRSYDLTEPIYPVIKFDLLICLEVAEHLEDKYADTLVESAIRCSDTIFWSAATKGQGGFNHVNEQPLEYWIEKFKSRGYNHRLLENELPVLPHDYYRKNAIEFKKA
jgi:hypothetical protein